MTKLSLRAFLAGPVLHASSTSAKRNGLTNVPPNITNAVNLGYASDTSFNPYIYRDGGGGGYINGYHVISYSDSFTTTGHINSSLTSFAHNTFAYFGYTDKTDPTKMYDFGTAATSNTGYRHFLGAPLKANIGNETNLTHTVISIWPNSNMIELQNKQGLAVYSVYNASHDSQIFYNTMITIGIEDPADVPDGQGLNATRIVPRLFYGSENLYGSFCTYRSGASGSTQEPADGNLYLFSTSTNGIKVARVPLTHKTDRAYYTYWNGNAWSSQQPSVADTSANLISFTYSANITKDVTSGNTTVPTTITYGPYGPGSGDVFWSPFFNTFVCVFQAAGLTSNFYMSYSTTQSLTSGWTEPMLIWETPAGADPMCELYAPKYELDFAGHAYPAWDTSGETLLLSYSACNGWTIMVKVMFEDFVVVGGNGSTMTSSKTKMKKVKTKSVKTKTKTASQKASSTSSVLNSTAVTTSSKTKKIPASTKSKAGKSSSTSTQGEVEATSSMSTSSNAAVIVRKWSHGHQHLHNRNSHEEQMFNEAGSALGRLSRKVLRRENYAAEDGEL